MRLKYFIFRNDTRLLLLASRLWNIRYMTYLMSWLKNNKHVFLFSIFLILLISIPALSALFHRGFFLTDDGDWMIVRFSAFYQALHDGQFPVRFLTRLNFEYGYPVATFLYPEFMYAGIPLHLLKIGFVDTIKIILGGSLIGTTIFVYLWLMRVFKHNIASFTGAFVSLYLPYHLYDVYKRGSVGEIFALLWVAFVLWMIERKSFFFVSIGIGLLLISHNTIALLFLPFLFIYALLRNSFPLKKLLLSFLLGILLSAFFTLPAIFELPFTNFSHTTIGNPLNYFADMQLLGVSTILIFILSLILLFSKKKLYPDNKLLISFLLVVTFLVILFGSSFSSIFWHIIPSAFIQFPFRLLSYLVFTSAFLAAFIITEIETVTKKSIILILFGFIVLFSSFPFIQPKIFIDHGEGFYFTNEATTTVQDEYMPKWVKEKPVQRPEQKVTIQTGHGQLSNLVYNNKTVAFSVDAKDKTTIRINTIYWPGWNIFVDNKQINFSYDNPEGVMEVSVPEGSHQVRVVFGETPLRLFADMISVVSLVGLLIFIFTKKKK